jgi:hypothetical protein
LYMVVISLSVQGMICEEQEGHVDVYIILYCVLQGSRVSPPWLLRPWGLEKRLALLAPLAFAHIPAGTFPSSYWHLKKRGKSK